MICYLFLNYYSHTLTFMTIICKIIYVYLLTQFKKILFIYIYCMVSHVTYVYTNPISIDMYYYKIYTLVCSTEFKITLSHQPTFADQLLFRLIGKLVHLVIEKQLNHI